MRIKVEIVAVYMVVRRGQLWSSGTSRSMVEWGEGVEWVVKENRSQPDFVYQYISKLWVEVVEGNPVECRPEWPGLQL